MSSSVGLNLNALSSATLSTTSLASRLSAGNFTTGSISSTGDQANVSGPGKLFSELQQLASQDPTKFKQVASDIASKLKAAAGDSSSTTGSSGNSFLADLASKFETAAQTGDVSSLLPPSGGPPSTGVSGGYNQQGQAIPSSTQSGVDLKSLFNSINQEVSSALSSLNTSS